MVDSAVTRWGMWSESKLHEVDDKYKPRWTPEQIFSEPKEAPAETLASNGDMVSAWLDDIGGSF